MSDLSNNPDVTPMKEIGGAPGTGSGKGSGKKKSKRKVVGIVIAVILVLLVAAAVAAGVIASKTKDWAEEKIDSMDHVTLEADELEIDEQVAKDLKDYRNILILGIDRRKGENIEACRSDAMIVMSIRKSTGEVKMISVVRDSFLQLDEMGELRIDKLTHAHAYGGPVNTIRALNRNLDLNIKEFVRVDWATVADFVDNLGGLEMTIHDYEIDEMNKYIKDTNKSLEGDPTPIKKAGKQTLNGVQVVTYCRIRKVGGGDSERASRIRNTIQATLSKGKRIVLDEKTEGLKKINAVCDNVLPQITTNIPTSEMMDLFWDQKSIEIKDSVGWPYTWDGAQLSGVWYDVPITLESNVIDLHEDIFEQKGYDPTDRVKEISELVSYESGYYEGQPVQYTNKDKK